MVTLEMDYPSQSDKPSSKSVRIDQETIKGTDRASPIYTPFHK